MKNCVMIAFELHFAEILKTCFDNYASKPQINICRKHYQKTTSRLKNKRERTVTTKILAIIKKLIQNSLRKAYNWLR